MGKLRNLGYKITVEYDTAGHFEKFTAEAPVKKTLWDWLQLLIVPLALLLIGSLFIYQQYQTSLNISEHQYQEEVLQTYIDHMSDLLINQSLLKPDKSDKWKAVQTVAQEETLTTLQRLDPTHRTLVVHFLAGSGLISGTEEHPHPIISLAYSSLSEISVRGISLLYAELYQADLSIANLDQAILKNADLAGANLKSAHLYRALLQSAQLRAAHLEQANLSRANLSGADLRDANLSGANLQDALVTKQQLDQVASLAGATMPDGSRHS